MSTDTRAQIVAIINTLGYAPSLRTMIKVMGSIGIDISVTGLYYHYTKLVESGFLIDTGESPKWILARCPRCDKALQQD